MLPKYEESIKFEDTNFAEVGITNGSIGSIYITGGGFIKREFKGIGVDSAFGWDELVWKKQPSRSADFSFSNIDNIDVGLVARCEVNVKYMNIKDYIDLRHILTHTRHFTVIFFNRDSCKWVSRDMYCSGQSLSKLFSLKKSVIGCIDVAIKFVGTNLDIDSSQTYTLSYDNNGGSGTINSISGINYSANIKIDSGSQFSPPQGKNTLKEFNTNSNGTGWHYLPNGDIMIFDDVTLYAIWE